MKNIIHENKLVGSHYVEPYAGGASIGLALLTDGFVQHISINDLDRAVYAFWHSVLYQTKELCALIEATPVTMAEWQRQREIQADSQGQTLLRLGLSTFFLNRTNRSGIISGGVIGGKNQLGDWKLDCRFNKTDLIERIRKISQLKDKISLHNKDASSFIKTVLPAINSNALVYFDPPYYIKGQQQLYVNFYKPTDHESIANLISNVQQYWVVSYDNVPEVRKLYKKYRSLSYKLHYTVQDKYQGKEILFFCDNLIIPNTTNPQHIRPPVL